MGRLQLDINNFLVVFVFTGLAVASEVKKILSPRLPPSAASYPAKGVSLIERRPKRKGKSKQANLKYGDIPPPEKRGRKCISRGLDKKWTFAQMV